MNITDNEKEHLYEQFKERMINEGMVVKTKSAAYKNLHNLKPAREHFGVRAEAIRKKFPFHVWSPNGLNWPDWELVRRLLYHAYGVNAASRISDDLLEEANKFAMDLTDKLFDANEKNLERIYNKERG